MKKSNEFPNILSLKHLGDIARRLKIELRLLVLPSRYTCSLLYGAKNIKCFLYLLTVQFQMAQVQILE